MFAGHVGVGLALARGERAVNPGVFVAAALLLDALLWAFVLLGWESLRIPAEFAATHQPHFVFPWSHGLSAVAGWAVLAGGLAFVAASRRARPALLVAAAVFSHWLLDALVHRPELPLAGAASTVVGLGLWNRMPVALALEAALVVGGLWLYLAGSGLARGRRAGLALLSLVLLAFTIAGMTVAPPPPSARAMAGSSLAMLVLVCGMYAWLGQRREKAQ
jgi:hypothetical protein